MESEKLNKSESKKLSRSVLLFVALDLSMLVINFRIADEVAHYSVSINLSGRQRMLSQRITKTLLQLQQNSSVENRQTVEQEFREAVRQFDRTLSVLETGGSVTNSDGRLIKLHRLDSGEAGVLLSQTLQVWTPMRENIVPLIAHGAPLTRDVIELASTQMLQKNLQLLELMDRLAFSQENESKERANLLRVVQLAVFILALLNFMVIVRYLHELTHQAFGRSRHFAELAMRDPLTGLFNRREFDNALKREFASARCLNTGMAVLALDLDGFKKANDTHGHEAGDQVLRVVSSRISEIMRANDTLARIGGDEFVLLCPGISDEDSASALSQRLIAAIGQPIEIGDAHVQVGASIGIAFISERINAPEELIREADKAMYAAKQAGRNRYVFYPV